MLIVDDDAAIRDVLEAGLTDGGYETVGVASGAEAIGRMEQTPGDFRALIVDIKLGNGPDGWAVASRCRELVASLPVVYMSGDSGHEWPSKGVPHSIFISKPFASAQVVTAVSSLINLADMGGAEPP